MKASLIFHHRCCRQRGFLQVDLLVGLAILSLAIVPLGLSFAHERQVLRMEYFHSVANELIDGEMEILLAGGWKNVPDGSQNYPVHSRAADGLPPGHFQLTKTGNHLRLEWVADFTTGRHHGFGVLAREVNIK
jgi:hypothetical protein